MRFFLWCSLILGVYAGTHHHHLDSSLSAKKFGKSDETVKKADDKTGHAAMASSSTPAPADAAHMDASTDMSDGDDTESDAEASAASDSLPVGDSPADTQPQAQTVNTAAVVSPTITIPVHNICVLTRCSSDEGVQKPFILKKLVDDGYNKWYTTYYNNVIAADDTFFTGGGFEYPMHPNKIPRWHRHDSTKFCIRFHQIGRKTLYSSWFSNIPANRRYFVVLGTAGTEVDDDEKSLVVSTSKRACTGKVTIRFKFYVDIFRTGDDYTEFPKPHPSEKHIDDIPLTHPHSVVNFRAGDREIDEKLLSKLATASGNIAPVYFILDITLLEAVDGIWTTDSNTLKTTIASPSKVESFDCSSAGGNVPVAKQMGSWYYLLHRTATEKTSTLSDGAKGAYFREFSTLKTFTRLENTYEDKLKEVKLISKFEKSSTITVKVKLGAALPDSPASATVDLGTLNYANIHAVAAGRFPHTPDVSAVKIYASVPAPTTADKDTSNVPTYEVAYTSLDVSFEANLQSFFLPIVVCGLFEKTGLFPSWHKLETQCRDPKAKAEHEG